MLIFLYKQALWCSGCPPCTPVCKIDQTLLEGMVRVDVPSYTKSPTLYSQYQSCLNGGDITVPLNLSTTISQPVCRRFNTVILVCNASVSR